MDCKSRQEWLWYLDLRTITLPFTLPCKCVAGVSIFVVGHFLKTISVFDTLVFSQHCYHPFYFAFIIVLNLIYLSLKSTQTVAISRMIHFYLELIS